MNRPLVLLLCALALLPAGRLAGQSEAKYAYGCAYNTPAVCNDGMIAFGVAYAYRDNTRLGSGDLWTSAHKSCDTALPVIPCSRRASPPSRSTSGPGRN